jgi:sugar transferase EpsL
MPVAERDRMGRAGRQFYENELAIDRAMDKFDAVFQSAVAARPGRTEPFSIYRIAKRLLDTFAALVGLFLCAPVIALAALAIRLSMGEAAFFQQQRPGYREKPFTLWKLRTMRSAIDAQGRMLPDAERLTRLGRFLRKTSIDELPQLWNVLRGDMSLVGPRPLLMHYLDRYTAEQRRRHEVRPGITGLAQIKGRNALRFSERLAYDVQYVERAGFRLDLEILFRTLLCMLTLHLEDRAGQDVRIVDDIGLSADEPSLLFLSKRDFHAQ